MENESAGERPPRERVRAGLSSAARLLERLRREGSADLVRVARAARIDPTTLEACRGGDARLDPVLQMRLAAAVVSECPSLSRFAHALYAQAQAELRFRAGDVLTHSTYPYSPLAAGRTEQERTPRGGTVSNARSLRDRSAEATEMARRLGDKRQELIDTAHRLVRDGTALRSAAQALLEARVVGFARALRQSGEPVDRALLHLHSAVAPVLAEQAAGGDELRANLERWLIAAYEAA